MEELQKELELNILGILKFYEKDKDIVFSLSGDNSFQILKGSKILGFICEGNSIRSFGRLNLDSIDFDLFGEEIREYITENVNKLKKDKLQGELEQVKNYLDKLK